MRKREIALGQWILLGLSLALCAPGALRAQTSSAVPQIVQSASCPDSVAAPGNPISSAPDYYCPLPEPATGGNTVMVAFLADDTGTPTFTVTDNMSDSFTIASSCKDIDANNRIFFLAYSVGVKSGARVIDIHATSLGAGYWTPQVAEFTGIGAFDTCRFSAGASASTNVSAGSITPTGAGELLTQWAFSSSATVQTGVFTVGSQPNISWQFAHESVYDADAMQYGIYSATAAITPAFTAAKADTWDSIAAFFIPGSAGAMPTQSQRIDHILHLNVMTGQGLTTLKAGFPSVGNEIVLSSFWGQGTCIKSVSDSNSNTWHNTGSCYNGGSATTYVSRWYCYPCSTSSNMAITVTVNTAGDGTILFYDILGGGGFDKTSGGQVGSSNAHNATLTTCSDCITPSGSGEVVFSEGGWDNGTASGMSSPSGGLFDAAYFSGNSYNGPQTVDQNNEASHYYTTSAAPLTYTWNMLLSAGEGVGSWSDLEDVFKTGSGLTPAPPTGLTGTVSSSGQ